MNQPISYPQFCALISASAEQYLDYLEYQFRRGDRHAGRNVVAVWDIQPGLLPTDYYLTTAERIRQPDHCQIWIRGRMLEDIRILQVLKSDGHTHSILIRDEGGCLEQFGKLYPHDIQIISDMTFLIRRLRDFYQEHDFSFMPPMPESVPELPEQFTQELSEEQLAAVNGVFTAPISYINGAPGTGKTRMVMSRCVLRYILNGKRVFLLAPTNNAVEQMLRSILPVLKDSGIDLETVYRFGTSTEEFANEYPQVAADTSSDALQENLTEQLKYLTERIEQAKQFQCTAESLRREVQYIESVNPKVADIFQRVVALQDSLNQAQQLLDVADTALSEAKHAHSSALRSREDISAEIESNKKQIVAKNTLASTLAYRLLHRKDRMRLLEESARLSSELSSLRQELSIREARVKELADVYQASQIRHGEAAARVKAARRDLSAETRMLTNESSHSFDYQSLIRVALKTRSNISDVLANYLAGRREKLCEAESMEEKYALPSLEQERASIQRQLDQIGVSAKQLQRQNALVLAGTIDASLKVLVPDDPSERTIPISHVFLDEAGYTSLARGMAAFSCGAPVTFLGDHRQLPPICEMNRIAPDHAPVCLWALSIAYFSELAFGNFDDLYQNNYCSEVEPSFRAFSRYSLNTSYRFGPELANILARHVYDNHFQGVVGAPFKIEVLDSPQSPGRYKRSSLSEASAIQQYVANHPSEEIAILSPYRGQIKLLTEILPHTYKDCILTVHRSQGREWDTVILSVVDGRSPYFVDSTLPIGRSVLNTAISRTRRKLVLVCDTEAWKDQHNQIIADLIRCSNESNLPF